MPQMMEEIVMSLEGILKDEVKREALSKTRGHHAQCVIDVLDHFLSDREHQNSTTDPWLRDAAATCLGGLCEISGLPPTRYILSGIRDVSLHIAGAFCFVYRGRCDRRWLSLKVMRRSSKMQGQNRSLRVFAKEAIVWSQLEHPNIIPFYGIFYLERKERFGFVSAWMENSDVMTYLMDVPEAPCTPFIHDIINGLQYLHAAGIVHGDLTGRKVLIDDHGNACLADFGSSAAVIDELEFTVRWAAPERVAKEASSTRESDVWSFGCVCYEILTGMVPFTGCSDSRVVAKLAKGEIPAGLEEVIVDEDEDVNEKLWRVMGKCWKVKPEERPGCAEILRDVEGIPGAAVRSGIRGGSAARGGELGFRIRAPGSRISENLSEGKRILEDLFRGKDVPTRPTTPDVS